MSGFTDSYDQITLNPVDNYELTAITKLYFFMIPIEIFDTKISGNDSVDLNS